MNPKEHPNQNGNESHPSPEFIAQQLRKPSGEFSGVISKIMNEVNHPLYDLVFDVMEIRDHEHILEIGFGNGRFFHDLFSKAEHINVHGIDLSEEMVREASDLNDELIASGNLQLQLGSSESLPFEDRTFDKIYCNMVAYFWDEPEVHLKEIHRVLKKGGKFYIGLRTKESMMQFPFVDYGFLLKGEMEWATLLFENGFKMKESVYKMDPEIEDEGRFIQLESACFVADPI